MWGCTVQGCKREKGVSVGGSRCLSVTVFLNVLYVVFGQWAVLWVGGEGCAGKDGWLNGCVGDGVSGDGGAEAAKCFEADFDLVNLRLVFSKSFAGGGNFDVDECGGRI